VLTPAREPRPRITKATIYYPLKRALLAATNKPCFITLIANIDSLKPYKPRIYREAISGGDIKQWEKSIEDKVNSLTKNYT
jgi:hypothetical protein